MQDSVGLRRHGQWTESNFFTLHGPSVLAVGTDARWWCTPYVLVMVRKKSGLLDGQGVSREAVTDRPSLLSNFVCEEQRSTTFFLHCTKYVLFGPYPPDVLLSQLLVDQSRDTPDGQQPNRQVNSLVE